MRNKEYVILSNNYIADIYPEIVRDFPNEVYVMDDEIIRFQGNTSVKWLKAYYNSEFMNAVVADYQNACMKEADCVRFFIDMGVSLSYFMTACGEILGYAEPLNWSLIDEF